MVLSKTRSRVAGYFRLLKHNPSPSLDNGSILIEYRTLRSVIIAAAESETHGVFYSTKQSISIRYILNQIGHKQLQSTPLRTDNSTSAEYVNKNIQMKRSKTWDIYLYWLRDKELCKKIKILWDKGSNNGADYFTKNYSIIYHRRIRNSDKYIHDSINM